jgi:hypothetical protein
MPPPTPGPSRQIDPPITRAPFDGFVFGQSSGAPPPAPGFDFESTAVAPPLVRLSPKSSYAPVEDSNRYGPDAPYGAPHTRTSDIGRKSQPNGKKVLKMPSSKRTLEGTRWRETQPGAVTKAPTALLKIPVAYDWAVRWPRDGALIVYNTTYLPSPPMLEHHPTYVCEDGLWGLREFTLEPHFFDHQSPHLAFFPVPTGPLYFRHDLFRLLSTSEYGEMGSRGRLLLGVRLVRKMGGLLEDVSDAAHKGKWWIDTYLKENPQVVGKKTTRVRMLLEGRFPSTVEANMFELMKILSDNGVKTKEELILCWVAMQRCARELIAYASFCSRFVRSYACRADLLQRLERMSIVEGFAFRGSVFTGSDLPFIDNFLDLNLPAFAYVWCKQYDVDETRFEEDNKKRSSVDPDTKLSTHFQLYALIRRAHASCL